MNYAQPITRINASLEQEMVMEIMRETIGKPEERESRLEALGKRLQYEHGCCGGVICKCDIPGALCPRHGIRVPEQTTDELAVVSGIVQAINL